MQMSVFIKLGHKQITSWTDSGTHEKVAMAMETAVRVNKFLHDGVIDENVVRVPMSSTSQCRACGQRIDKIN